VSASATGSTLVLTAKTAGVPFSAAASGTGTWSGVGNTAAGFGASDYGKDANWSGDDTPNAGDDVVIPGGAVNILYGLNQSAVAIGGFTVEADCRSRIGRWQSGRLHYLRIDPDSFVYRGSGSLAAFDLGAANISLLVESGGSPERSGLNAVYLKGTNLSTVEVVRGSVGIAALAGDVSKVDTLLVGFTQGQQSDTEVVVGSGTELTTLSQSGGRCTLRCAATNVHVSSGSELTTEGTGAITTLDAYGTVYAKSSGTIGTLNAYGRVDFSRDRTPKTITTLVEHPGGVVVVHSGITISNRVPLAVPGEFKLIYV
jgi:hypothetical protein